MLIFEMLFVILHLDGRPSESGQYDRRLGRKWSGFLKRSKSTSFVRLWPFRHEK